MSLARFHEAMNLQKILKLQRVTRAYLGKMRFRKVVKVLASDPQIMHKRLLHAVENIHERLDRSPLAAPDGATLPCGGVLAGPTSPISNNPVPDGKSSSSRRQELNLATIAHCQQQIAMFEHMMRVAREDLQAGCDEDLDAAPIVSPSSIPPGGRLAPLQTPVDGTPAAQLSKAVLGPITSGEANGAVQGSPNAEGV